MKKGGKRIGHERKEKKRDDLWALGERATRVSIFVRTRGKRAGEERIRWTSVGSRGRGA